MSHKAAVKYQKVEIEEDTENESESHPLESSNLCVQFFHYIFHIWVFKLVSITQRTSLQITDTPQPPQHCKVSYAYQKWMKIYHKRRNKKLSTSTASMIYHTQKYKIFISQISIVCTMVGALYFQYIILRDHLYPCLTKIVVNSVSNIDYDKVDLLWEASTYAIYNLVICIVGTCFRSLAMQLSAQIVVESVACVQYQLFKKLLSIDMNEPNKQTVLNLAGAEIIALMTQLDGLLFHITLTLSALTVLSILLYKTVGNAGFFGILFIIFVGLPFQMLAGAGMAINFEKRLRNATKRTQLITQLISGVRYLKCTVSEMALVKQIGQYRVKELEFTKKQNDSFIILFLFNLVIPSLMVVVILVMYVFVFDNTVDTMTMASLVMVANMGSQVCKSFPVCIVMVATFAVGTKRIDDFLSKRDTQIGSYKQETKEYNCDQSMVQIKNACFKWESDTDTADNFMLKNVNLNIDSGKLVAIIGKVGSGKTSLIQSILGEMSCESGSINVNVDKFGYCAQLPYIQNGTFRDNIIMDLKFDERRYRQVIYAADLESDLKQLQFGDLTEIGSEGINLSGGQKIRLCFARTLYRKDEYDLFLMDDPLSAVDIYVGKHMFFNGIIRYLQLKQSNKTCVMTVNSHLYLLKYFDEIIVMENGEIKLHTETKNLLNQPKSNNLYQKYSYLLPEITDQNNGNGKSREEKVDMDHINIESNEISVANNGSYLYFNEQCQLVPPDWNVYKDVLKYSQIKVDAEQEFIHDQTAEIRVSKCRLTLMVLAMLVLFCCCSGLLFCDVWLVVWRENVDPIDTSIPYQIPKLIEISGDKSDAWFWSLWCALMAFVVLTTFLLFRYISNILINASHSIFAKTLLNILKCNTLFFDLIPRGQLLNVLSSDPNTMDGVIAVNLLFLLILSSTMFGFFVMIAVTTPSILVLFVFVLFPICFVTYRKLEKSVYSLSALWKISFSPILSLFDESITGLDSIRAYKLQNYFLNVIRQRIDTANRCKYNALSVQAWGTFYLTSFLYLCVAISTVYFAILLLYYEAAQDTDIRFLMLSVWWYSSFAGYFLNVSILSIDLSTQVVSIQKMFFYCTDSNIEQRYKSRKQIMSTKNKDEMPDCSWPAIGNLHIFNLKLKYRENFEIVLNIDETINIEAGTKLAICGRTGSGKSSILVSIFRLFEPCIGSNVVIDGFNIYELGLFEVRSKISIIMQSPVLFTGALRFNLDPFNEYSDVQIWHALKDVQLFDLINGREHKLECEVGENGANFSVGESQLLCFARAILKQTKILFMDEPTSSIDKATDKVIQNLIRSDKFEETTIICIAHRLQTILDYEYIMVLEKGKVLEYDTPAKLVKNKQSQFSNLLRVSNLYYK